MLVVPPFELQGWSFLVGSWVCKAVHSVSPALSLAGLVLLQVAPQPHSADVTPPCLQVLPGLCSCALVASSSSIVAGFASQPGSTSVFGFGQRLLDVFLWPTVRVHLKQQCILSPEWAKLVLWRHFGWGALWAQCVHHGLGGGRQALLPAARLVHEAQDPNFTLCSSALLVVPMPVTAWG